VSMHVEHELPETVHCGGVIGSENGNRIPSWRACPAPATATCYSALVTA